MRKMTLALAASAAAILASPAMATDSITYNTQPAQAWQYGGGGNNYSPSNSAVLTDTAGSQLSLRMHTPGNVASASNGNGVYTFALGTPSISFDFGVNQSIWEGTLADPLITLRNLLTGDTVSFNPTLLPDNWVGTGGDFGDYQNSERFTFGFLSGLNYDPNANNTYSVNLTAGGHSLTTYAQVGTGAVPEPATWAMMIVGFGAVGFGMRRSRRARLLTQVA